MCNSAKIMNISLLNFHKTVTVHAPGTVANLVCGFDILGLCLQQPFDVMEVRLLQEKKVTIISGDGFALPTNPALNTAGAPLIEMLKSINENIGFEVTIHKHIKPGSGIGSSAASAAGAVVGANQLLGNIFSKPALVQFAMHGEKVASGVMHADNIAPCIYGGITLIRSNEPLDIIVIPSPALFVTIVHPQIEVKTADARQILKKEISMKKAIAQWGNVAGLIAGFFSNDTALIGRSLHDNIVEPVRSILIPHFHEVKEKCLAAGAIGGGISGSGPSIFMLSKNETIAQNVASAMKEVYDKTKLDYHIYVSAISKTGVEIIE